MPEALKELPGTDGVYCVHRLDTGVGGVMVYAKTGAAAARLSGCISTGGFVKEYLAVVSGRPVEPRGLMHDLLFKDQAKNKSYVVKRMRRGVREAELEYETLETGPDTALLRLRLHTGRSHQIRVQLASRAMPILGDMKYGGVRGGGIALFACRLCFPHPESGEALRFSALPPDAAPWDRYTYVKEARKNV